jgi:hypothetical protein
MWILFQINHVDPPLMVKGAELIHFIIQGKFSVVNKKEVSGLRIQDIEGLRSLLNRMVAKS